MKLTSNELFKAVRYALYTGAAAAVGLAAAPAFAQDSNSADSSQKLDTITVTGSNIRRVDIETSNPVITVDRAAIEKTGKLTVGDLLQQLPAVTGGQVNAQVNNGGSYAGSSSIGLRGLGSQRTLVLINGQRFLNADPNSIPSNLIERIEVLTDGASAVYGSDAIAGVVNFILRKDYQGAEFRADYGTSDKDDGTRKGYHFTFGQTSDKGSIMAGINYNQQDQILAGNRKFGKFARDLTASSQTPPYTFIGGSSSPQFGRIVLPSGSPLATQLGCTQVSLNAGANGQSADANNYHCFGNSDKYNYAPTNLISTPQERTSVFVNGTYHLTDHVDAYLTAFHSKTSSSSQLAPAIIGTNAPGILQISSQSYYNPFGIDFGGANGSTFQLRGITPRRTNASNNTDQINTGLKGDFDIGSQNWTWDAGFGYGHVSILAQKFGLPNFNDINANLGPSFLDPTTGVVTCGTPDAPITTGCTPFNIFGLGSLNDPAAIKAIQDASRPSQNTFLSTEKYEHLDVSGGLFDLPAGTVQLGGGVSHRDEYTRSTIDSLLNIDPATGGCILGSQCASGLTGGYNVKEAYAELFVPVLKDLPFVHALNVTLGDRYSKYSTFGSTSNWKIALEYRPIEDLLLRGTVSKVFRAPTVGDVFGGATASAPTVGSDPCEYAGTGANPNAGNPACVGVPATGPFANNDVDNGNQIGALTSGSQYAGIPLGPENGKSFDFGVVYNPSWLDGFSASADIYRVYLLNTITGIGAQTVINLCYNGVTLYCPFVTRFQSGPNQGQFSNILQPTGNLGRTDTTGVDVNLNYRLPEFAFGRFSVGVNATYLKEFNVDPAPGTNGDSVFHLAGHFVPFFSGALSGCPGNTGVCSLPRWRALGQLNWNLGMLDASWRLRYIGRQQMGNPNLAEDQAAYPGFPGSVIKYGAYVYNDLTFGINLDAINTRVDFGVDNVSDKQPPFFGYDSQTLNLGTDPSTFDVIGRYYHGSVTVKF